MSATAAQRRPKPCNEARQTRRQPRGPRLRNLPRAGMPINSCGGHFKDRCGRGRVRAYYGPIKMSWASFLPSLCPSGECQAENLEEPRA
ncbi:hypothetical protein MRX96_019191 [Rhipicephalus microplus]